MADTTTEATQPRDQDRTTNDILATWAQKPVTNFDEINDNMTAEQITHMTNRPDMTPSDYLADDYFRPIYEYLRDDKLTGNKDVDRKTILMSDNYYLESDLLYKVTPTRGRKEQRILNSYQQLCIPQKYASNLLKEWHGLLGHYSSRRLLPTLRTRFWWPTILTNVKNVSKICDISQISKTVSKPHRLTLNPWPVPACPWELASMDHKALARKPRLEILIS